MSQDHLKNDTEELNVHPRREPRINNEVNTYKVESNESETDRATLIIHKANRFIGKSRKARQAVKQKPGVLSRTRSGKNPALLLKKKEKRKVTGDSPAYPRVVFGFQELRDTSLGDYA